MREHPSADTIRSVAESSIFEREIAFDPARAAETLREIPAACGVVALYGAEGDRPFLTKAANLRRRLQRLLLPDESQTKRLNLRNRVQRIAWRCTGSEFESMLVLYRALTLSLGRDEACNRLKLHAPYMLRFAVENRFPRLYVTNRLTRKAMQQSYGPFPSRAAAERYCDAVLDLFKIRRCYEELVPFPEHPGCVYGEMKKCIAPCQQRCTDEEYAKEADGVESFLKTHGESMLAEVAAERDHSSEEMEFEAAAAAHTQWQRVKATADLADEIIAPISELRAVILQPAPSVDEIPQVEVFLLHAGTITGPGRFSTLGVRHVKEQSAVGSSLFAQPLMLQAVPLDESSSAQVESPETRLKATLAALETKITVPESTGVLSDHLALLRRWYFRPEKQRSGKILLSANRKSLDTRQILRHAARIASGVVGDRE